MPNNSQLSAPPPKKKTTSKKQWQRVCHVWRNMHQPKIIHADGAYKVLIIPFLPIWNPSGACGAFPAKIIVFYFSANLHRLSQPWLLGFVACLSCSANCAVGGSNQDKTGSKWFEMAFVSTPAGVHRFSGNIISDPFCTLVASQAFSMGV